MIRPWLKVSVEEQAAATEALREELQGLRLPRLCIICGLPEGRCYCALYESVAGEGEEGMP